MKKIITCLMIGILFISCVETGYRICPIWNTRNTLGSNKKSKHTKIKNIKKARPHYPTKRK